jgi:hypothetical protein
MNLNTLSRSMTRSVTPAVPGTVRISTGPVKNADYSVTPGYAAPVAAEFDIQAMDGGDIAHMDALNLQKVARVFYFNGNLAGLDRQAGKGGDVIEFGTDARVPAWLRTTSWLVTDVSEPWDAGGWVRVIGTKQTALVAS